MYKLLTWLKIKLIKLECSIDGHVLVQVMEESGSEVTDPFCCRCGEEFPTKNTVKISSTEYLSNLNKSDYLQ